MRSLKKNEMLSGRTDDYKQLISGISALIQEGRTTAVRQVNAVLVATYWLTGRRIVEFEQQGKNRARYGEALLRCLSQDLKQEFGKGWSESHLRAIRQFYLIYRWIEKRYTACSELALAPSLNDITRSFSLSWSHYRLLMRMEDSAKRRFYEKECLRSHWSARQLDREIQAMLFERTALSKRKDLVLKKANKDPIIVRPEDEIKDSYVLEFLNLKDEYSELDLEEALIQHLERFLLELGAGFTFVSRQRRFNLDGDEYRMDLVLYHIPLKCYVILDLKIGRFTHAYAGQMNLYLNWARDHLIPQVENDPIGIVLCADKSSACAKYATGGMSNKIFVSKYQLRLPKPADLQRELQRGRDLFMQHHIRQRIEAEDNKKRSVKARTKV